MSAHERTLQIGGWLKALVMIGGELLISILSILLIVDGQIVAGLLGLFIGTFVWLIVADIVTGILLLPIVGLAYLASGRRR